MQERVPSASRPGSAASQASSDHGDVSALLNPEEGHFSFGKFELSHCEVEDVIDEVLDDVLDGSVYVYGFF